MMGLPTQTNGLSDSGAVTQLLQLHLRPDLPKVRHRLVDTTTVSTVCSQEHGVSQLTRHSLATFGEPTMKITKWSCEYRLVTRLSNVRSEVWWKISASTI